jgi:poly(A) polymerase
LYEPELLDTPRRTAATISLLRSLDADLLALQEVTPAFLEALLGTPWVREHFFLSEGPAATTVTPYGTVLLSRFPFISLVQSVFSRDKRIIAGELARPGGSLWVATLHLTSNHDPSGGSARAAQILTLLEWAQTLEAQRPTAPDLLVAGDFNFGDGAPETQSFTDAGFADVWAMLRPGEAGYTYEPSRNYLAALTTTYGQSQRFDRVLVRSPSGRLAPRKIGLFADEPLPGRLSSGGEPLFLSDHFGLSCTLLLAEASAVAPSPSPVRQGPAQVLSVPPVHQAAVVLIPPESLWPPIEALRSKHDRHYERWMPHVTLLYPFVPEEHFAQAEALLSQALSTVEPFQVTLSGFGHFEQRGSVTAWLRPETRPHGALESLQARLQAALPQCDEQGRKSEHGFTPHLSVGQLPRSNPVEFRRALSAWERDWEPISFEAREVCLISRRGDGPFEVRRRVPLGAGPKPASTGAASHVRSSPSGRPATPTQTGLLQAVLEARGEWESAEARSQRAAAVGQLEAVCEDLGLQLHPYGSYLLGTSGTGSDVDAVVVGPAELSREDFAQALLQALSQQVPAASGRFVADAAIPLVKLSIDGVHFDVSYASRPEGVEPRPPRELLTLHGEQLDTASFRSLNGWADTTALLAAVEHEGAGAEHFRAVLRAVRAWAKARGVYSHALGYLGGLSWAVMAAWSCLRAPPEAADTAELLLAHFFETFSTWVWPQPVTLTPETARYSPSGKRDLMPVVAPALPPRNTARNVSRSTLQVIRDELTRAREQVHQACAQSTLAGWEALFVPADFTHETPARLVVSIEAPAAEARERAAGWVLGHLTALVYRLEGDRRIFARPFPPGQPEGPFIIGLSARGSSAAAVLSAEPGSTLEKTLDEFRESFLTWSHRPPEAQLSLQLRLH